MRAEAGAAPKGGLRGDAAPRKSVLNWERLPAALHLLLTPKVYTPTWQTMDTAEQTSLSWTLLIKLGNSKLKLRR